MRPGPARQAFSSTSRQERQRPWRGFCARVHVPDAHALAILRLQGRIRATPQPSGRTLASIPSFLAPLFTHARTADAAVAASLPLPCSEASPSLAETSRSRAAIVCFDHALPIGLGRRQAVGLVDPLRRRPPLLVADSRHLDLPRLPRAIDKPRCEPRLLSAPP